MKYSLLGLLFSTIIVIAAPDFYRIGSDAAYPTEKYITGVGESPVLKRAIAQAKAHIAGQLKTTINQRIIIETTDSKTIQSQLTDSRVSQTLSNTQLVRQVELDGVYYVMLVLNKQQYISGLRSDLQDLAEKIYNQNLDIGRLLDNRQYQTALDYYTVVLPMSRDYDAKRSLYNYLAPQKWVAPYDKLSGQSAQQRLTALTNSLSWVIKSGDNQKIGVAEKAKSPLVLQVRANKQPLPNHTIQLTYADGTVLGAYNTDSTGSITAMLYGLPLKSIDKAGPSIQASLVLNGSSRQWQGLLPTQSISYTLDTSDGVTKPVIALRSYWESDSSTALVTQLRRQAAAIGLSVVASSDSVIAVPLSVTVSIASHDTLTSFDKSTHWISGFVRLSRSDNTAYFIDMPFNTVGETLDDALATLPGIIKIPKLALYKIVQGD